MTAPEWLTYFTAAKSALDILKLIRSELPQGADANKAQNKIEEAEIALLKSKAEFAKALGYRLCQCTWPPQIMLWNKTERARICPECADRFPPPRQQAVEEEDDWITVRR